MAELRKERARKPIIPEGTGIALPTYKSINGIIYYVAEIREPWNKDGYQIYSILLSEKEMINMAASWLTALNERDRP